MQQIDPLPWHFFGLATTVALATLQSRISRVAPLWQVISAFPGTVLHELAHLLVAAITGGRPTGFTVIPRCREDRLSDGRSIRMWTLGSVTIRNPGFVSAFPSGFAPLLLNVIAWYLYSRWFTWYATDLIHTLELYVAVSVLCSASIPSYQDVKVAFSSAPGVLFYGSALAVVVTYYEELRNFLTACAH